MFYQTVDYLAGSSFADKAYTYDAAGNRISAVNGSTTNYTPNNLNQYIQAGNNSYTYDANGNLTSDGTNTYTYDHENRLSEGTVPERGLSLSYKYDSFGRRIQKGLSPQGTVPEITTYLYDGDQIIAEYDLSGALQTKYIYGPGIDEPVLMTKGGQSYYYHFDGLGSVTSLTNSTGSAVESYTYDAFGKPLIKNSSGTPLAASSIGNRYLFTGREYDAETGLYFYRARYYSPEIGRFLQRDPVGYIAGLNLYTYCSNNAINWIDPMGWDKEGKGESKKPDELDKDKPWWEKTLPYIIGGAQWHFDYSSKGERLIETIFKGKWYRFNKLGELVEHTGRSIGKATGKAAEALKYLMNIKTDFFLKMPIIIIIIPPELRSDPASPFYDPGSGGGVI